MSIEWLRQFKTSMGPLPHRPEQPRGSLAAQLAGAIGLADSELDQNLPD
jgi:hypothetical protein